MIQQKLSCLSEVKELNHMCYCAYEVIHHKNLDKNYPVAGTGVEKELCHFVDYLETYKNPHQCAQAKAYWDEKIASIFKEVNPDLTSSIGNLQIFIQRLIDSSAPLCKNFTPEQNREAKETLFQLSMRLNQLIEPESV